MITNLLLTSAISAFEMNINLKQGDMIRKWALVVLKSPSSRKLFKEEDLSNLVYDPRVKQWVVLNKTSIEDVIDSEVHLNFIKNTRTEIVYTANVIRAMQAYKLSKKTNSDLFIIGP